MASRHILKNTETEIVFKCYVTDSAGGTVDISLETNCTKASQVYVAPTSVPDESSDGFFEYNGSRVYITGLWWGLKKDKQLDICRVVTPPNNVHNHYYLINSGFYEYNDFADRIYANKDIRLIFDGPGHCIIRLRKEGWNSKVETAVFGAYDNESVVGS